MAKKHNHLNRILAVILTLALVVPSVLLNSNRAEASVTGVVSAKELYMRTGAGTDFDKVRAGGEDVVLVYGQEITVLGEKDGWYHVRAVFNGQVVEGYSLAGKNDSAYIEIPDGADLTGEYPEGTITAVELNVRSGPSTDYPIVKVNGVNCVLTKDTTVSVIETKNDWCHIYVDFGGATVEGYCLGKYVSMSGETAPQPQYAYGKVIATRLNVRKGPGTEYSILEVKGENVVFDNGQEVTILGEENDWYHIAAAFKGNLVDGYSLGSYIEVTKGTVPGDTAGGSTDSGNGGKTDSSSDKTEDTKPTDTKPVDSTGGKSDKNDSGEYVPTSPIDFSHGVPEGYEVVERSFSSRYAIPAKVTAAGGLNMRQYDIVDSKVLAVLAKDTPLTVLRTISDVMTNENGEDEDFKWYKIVAFVDGEYKAGYVMSNYVEFTDFTDVTAKANKSIAWMRKSVNKTTKVKTSAGATVKIAKNKLVNIIGETKNSDGVKYYKISFTYKGEEVKGYAKADNFNLSATTTKFTAKYMVKSEPETNYGFKGANALVKNSTGLTVHIGPKNSTEVIYTSDGKAVMLYTGDSVEVLDTVIDDTALWCYVKFYFNGTEYKGYIRSIHVDADSSLQLMSEEELTQAQVIDFETRLELEGFPESYKAGLRELHMMYPDWKFKAYHTGLDWNEAVEAEAEVGVSLLPKTWSLEWLSFEPGAYSWKNDTFTVFDGSSWVAASKDAVRYYMDPRNFLNYAGIFQYEILEYNPGVQTLAGAANILKTTAFGNGATFTYKDDYGNKRTATYVDTFAMAAEHSGVSLYHLVSRSKNEIGNGTPSNSVSGKVAGYEGLYNFYNIGANDSAIPGQNIINGLKFAKNANSRTNKAACMIPWTNPFRAIMGGAYYIGCNYINKGQNTLYFERFNVLSGEYYPNYTHQYMTNLAAPATEGTSTSRGYSEDAASLALEFLIPVYLNMPEEAVPAPEKAYNPNNWLKTLKVTDGDGNKFDLTPTFDYTEDQEYSLIVDYSVDTIKFKTSTVSSLAEVTSKSTFHPEEGYNKFTIKVKAENGDVRKYKINIYREENPNPTTDEPAEPTPGVDEEPEITEAPVVTEEPYPTEDLNLPKEPVAGGELSPTIELYPSEAPYYPEEPASTEEPGTVDQTASAAGMKVAVQTLALKPAPAPEPEKVKETKADEPKAAKEKKGPADKAKEPAVKGPAAKEKKGPADKAKEPAVKGPAAKAKGPAAKEKKAPADKPKGPAGKKPAAAKPALKGPKDAALC